MIKKQTHLFLTFILLSGLMLLLITGCQMADDDNKQVRDLPTNQDGLTKIGVDPDNGYLYFTDTVDGDIFRSDLDGVNIEKVTTTASGSTGKIYFHNKTAYVLVGLTASGAMGVHRFDPDNPGSITTHFPSSASLSAQYMVFENSEKTYVTHYSGGVYWFNPSTPDSEFTIIDGTDPASATGLQDIILEQGKLYVTLNNYPDNSCLMIYDGSHISLKDLGSGGATPLLAYDGKILIGHNSYAGTGSLDYYDPETDSVSPGIITNTDVAAMAFHAGSNRIYFINGINTCYIDTSIPIGSWTAEAVSLGTAPGSDMVLYMDTVYVINTTWSAPYTNTLYIIDAHTGEITGAVDLNSQ
jgi:sugar lactone lactonase YvrE